jgi:putative RecB family exonuclease
MCSLKFAFQYIYRAESERTASNLPFGRAFHIAASHYAVSLMEGKRITPSELHEVFVQWFRAECAASVNVVYKANENIDTLTEHGKVMLSALLSNWFDWDNILSVAHAFKVQVPGLDKPLIGEYDLVIKDDEDTTIVDWKTSAARWPEGKADKDFQTTAFSYAYLMESSQHTIPAFRFDVVTKAKTPSSEKHYTRRTEDDLNRFVKIAVAVEQAVKKEVFLPAETSFSCGDCQFGSACKEWHRKSAARHICLAA